MDDVYHHHIELFIATLYFTVLTVFCVHIGGVPDHGQHRTRRYQGREVTNHSTPIQVCAVIWIQYVLNFKINLLLVSSDMLVQ